MIPQGSLVKWYEHYHDFIVKNAGYGIIIDRRSVRLGINDSVHHQYLICAPHQIRWFASNEIELIGEKDGIKSAEKESAY